MTELKTKQTNASVDEFLDSLDESKRADAAIICKIMSDVTHSEPKMWGSSIVGFGSEHLKYESGRELDWFKVGFSPRKQNLTLYVFKEPLAKYQDLLTKLGKHTTGKGCLYIKSLSDVDPEVLTQIIELSLDND